MPHGSQVRVCLFMKRPSRLRGIHITHAVGLQAELASQADKPNLHAVDEGMKVFSLLSASHLTMVLATPGMIKA